MEDQFLAHATARITALIADQERLLQVIRDKETELVRANLSAATKSFSMSTRT
jgi:hypothetical protein